MIILGDIEVDAAEHCNLKCAQCSHLSPHFKKVNSNYTTEEFKRDIDNLKRLVSCTVFRFVGGEPLLNNDLEEWVKYVKQSNISQKTSIFTNGLLIGEKTLSTLSHFDDIRVSMYNLDKEKFNTIKYNTWWLQKRLKSHSIVSNHLKTFLKFNLIEKNNSEELVDKVFKSCYHSKNSYSLYKSRLYRCFATRKKGKFLQKFDSKVKGDYSKMLDPNTDSIKIDENTSSITLFNFLFSDKPLEGCKWCLGCSGKRFSTKQIESESDEFALLSDLDFYQGKSYVSNCLLSWHKDRVEEVCNDEFFNKSYLPDFDLYHSR